METPAELRRSSILSTHTLVEYGRASESVRTARLIQVR